MRSLPGLTSRKVQNLLNSLCSHAETYLEVGCYIGASGAGAIHNNSVHAYFVDNWKDGVQTYKDDIDLPPNNKQLFLDTIKAVKGNNTINIFDCDMFDVDLSTIKPIDVFFYDADHSKEATSKAIQYYSTVLSDQAIIIIDDANFEGVVDGARDGIVKAGLNVSYERILLNEIEDPEAWWNGLYIVIINK